MTENKYNVRLYEYDTQNGKKMLLAYYEGERLHIATRGEEELQKIREECENVPFSQLKRIKSKYRINKKKTWRTGL